MELSPDTQNVTYQESQNSDQKKHFTSEPAGVILNRFGLLILLVGILLAAWGGMTPIVILLGFIFAAVGISRLWSRFCLKNIQVKPVLSARRLFPGETVELKMRLENRKLLPLPWIQVDEEVPVQLVADSRSLEPGDKPGTGLITRTTSLLWYTATSWKYELFCAKRGYYAIGPTTVTSGDIFGFYPRTVRRPQLDYIIVYPRIFAITDLGIPSLYPVGDTRAELRIFQDPIRTIGLRDYTPRDSLRLIHWKATARHQNLQVKIFEPTTTLNIVLFLAVDSFQHYGAISEDDFELGISATASIASHVSQQGNPVGLYVNTRQADTGESAIIPPGSSGGQLVNILEALAKTTATVSSPSDVFLQSEARGLPWGTTFILVVSQPNESLVNIINDMAGNRRKFLVIQVGGNNVEGTDSGISWQKISIAGDMAKTDGETR
ncbi:DUF58 domain-containing protein [Chloroflexota bacterium]